MSKMDKIIQYHLDNDLGSVSEKFKKQLSKSELKNLSSAIELNNKLKSIKLSDNFGKNSLKEGLEKLEFQTTNTSKNNAFSFSFMKFGVATFALVLLVGTLSFGIFGGKSNTNNSSTKISSINFNNSIENINKINLADAETEKAQLQDEAKIAETAKVDLSGNTNMSEAINENF